MEGRDRAACHSLDLPHRSPSSTTTPHPTHALPTGDLPQGDQWEKAWAVFAAMKRAGLEPSTVSYNALISACEHCGELDRCAPLPPFQCCVSCRRKAPLRVY